MIGYRDIGSGPPVLLLHGLGGDAGQSLGLVPDSLLWRRIAPEMPGHGSTELSEDDELTFEAFGDAAAEVLDRRAPGQRVPVAGVSMGAGVALALATRHPELVKRLILIRPSHLDTSPVPNLAAFVEIAFEGVVGSVFGAGMHGSVTTAAVQALVSAVSHALRRLAASSRE